MQNKFWRFSPTKAGDSEEKGLKTGRYVQQSVESSQYRFALIKPTKLIVQDNFDQSLTAVGFMRICGRVNEAVGLLLLIKDELLPSKNLYATVAYYIMKQNLEICRGNYDQAYRDCQ